MDLIVALGVLLILTVVSTILFKAFFLPKNVNVDKEKSEMDEQDQLLVKKYDAVDLHKLRRYPLMIGLFITLAYAIVMVEYKTYAKEDVIVKADVSKIREEVLDIPITEMPPPEPPKPKTSMKMEVVPEEELIEEEEEIIPEEEEDEEEEEFFEEEEEEIEEEVIEPQVHFMVEQNAEPAGGMMEFNNKLNYRIGEVLGGMDLDGVQQGVILLQYIVLENGKVSAVEVLQGVDPQVDRVVAQEFVRMSPRWEPGKIQGAPVRQKMQFPVAIIFD